MKLKLTDNIIGWIGTALVLSGYLCLSLGIFGNDWRYHLCMLVGSLGLVWLAYRSRLWQVVALNAVFATFAVAALIRLSL